MKLKSDIDYAAFFKQAKHCQGNVYYHTEEGDHMNLKSVLSMYVFATLNAASDAFPKGESSVIAPEDYDRLMDYLILQMKNRKDEWHGTLISGKIRLFQ